MHIFLKRFVNCWLNAKHDLLKPSKIQGYKIECLILWAGGTWVNKSIWPLLWNSCASCFVNAGHFMRKPLLSSWRLRLCVAGPSAPPVWRLSTGRPERLPAGTALSALLLQSMLGAALHCVGQRWHWSRWVAGVCARTCNLCYTYVIHSRVVSPSD